MISVVLPCFNEQDNVEIVHDSLSAVLPKLDPAYEIIFVNDGSSDGTARKLAELAAKDPRVQTVEFSRNFGHQAAICAGLDLASGDAVVMMDADMQHPPEMIPALVEKWKEGFDVVYTVRVDPPDIGYFKKSTSRFFYKLINVLAKIELPENSADFRLVDRKVVACLRDLKETTKFFRGLIRWIGYRQVGISYTAAPRHAGVTKYTVWKMVKFAFDGITSFSTFPLHIATMVGFVVSVLSFVYASYALYIKIFTNLALPGWASILIPVLFIGGIQLMCLGIIGEYIGRIYSESKARPTYIIRTINGKEPRVG